MTFRSLTSINAYISNYFLVGAVTITFAATWIVCSKYFDLKPKLKSLSTFKAKKIAKSNNIIELCVSDIESIINAKEAGVDSVEICSDREQGGITASLGLIQYAVHLLKSSNIEIHALIRPRGGDFCYSYDEFDVIIRDILACKAAGVSGVVVGVLDKYGYIDRPRLEVLRELSKGLLLTFHRAYDVCQSPGEALETIISVGCDRLLTSGCAQSAASLDGIQQLKVIAVQVDNRIKVIAAGGVNSYNARKILTFTHVHGVHAGSSVTALTSSSYKHIDVNKIIIINNDTDTNINKCNNNGSSSTDNNRISSNNVSRNRVSIGLKANEDLSSWSVVSTELASKLVENATSTLNFHFNNSLHNNPYQTDTAADGISTEEDIDNYEGDFTKEPAYSMLSKSTSNFWNFDDNSDGSSEDENDEVWSSRINNQTNETKELDIDTLLIH